MSESNAVLVTGAAGFIGFHLSQALLAKGVRVLGVDNLNDYYSPDLKRDRLAMLRANNAFEFRELDIADRGATAELFEDGDFDVIVNLAAQAGVRYSIENPAAYIDSNLTGFANILEGARARGSSHLIYASSSSVYGANQVQPFAIEHSVDHPVSLYAATKKANELMAHTYSHLFGLPCTGLRFFTVYGPWGRPDMAYWSFTKKLLAGEPIQLFNHGDMERDFTYVDDVVESILRLIDLPAPEADPGIGEAERHPGTSHAPWRVYNIGNHSPVRLERFVSILEEHTGREAQREYLPMQPGDVQSTCADVGPLQAATGFSPSTTLESGLERFVSWYREYHNLPSA